MRRIHLPIVLIPLLALGGCEAIKRSEWTKACDDFFHYSREDVVGSDGMERVCACAIDRELAGQTPIATIPDRPDHELPEFRRHIPDCVQANGGSPTGVAARESAGHAPRPAVFDPATMEATEPEGEIRPEGSTIQPGPQGSARDDVSQAMKDEEPRLICPQPKGGRTISIGKPVGP